MTSQLFSDSCSYSLTGVRGNFTSPDYPQHYAHDLDCSWTITVSAGYYIYLHFEHPLYPFKNFAGKSHCESKVTLPKNKTECP